MEQSGRGAQTASSLNDLLVGSGATGANLAHDQSLATAAGVGLSTVGTAAVDVTSAEAALGKVLTVSPLNQTDVNLATAHVAAAMVSNGASVADVSSALTSTASALGSSNGGGSAALFAAMVALGITDPDQGSSANTQGSVAAQQSQLAQQGAKAAAAAAQAKAEAANQAAAQAATSSGNASSGSGPSASNGSSNSDSASDSNNSTGSSSTASNLTGTSETGDLSGLAAKSGKVAGKFQMGVILDGDHDTGGTAGFKSRTGVTPASISGYVNMSADGTFQTQNALNLIDDAAKNGVPKVSLSISAMSATTNLTRAQLEGIKAAVAEGKKLGIEVDFRYGYEMNYGGGTNQGQRVNNNNQGVAAFQAQWAQVAAIVNPDRNSTPPMKMVWSPNVYSGGDLSYSAWLPKDPSTIDVVGVDWYQNANTAISTGEVENVMNGIYPIAQKLNVPFIFGETGLTTSANGSTEASQKYDLLNTLNSQALKDKYPLYEGYQYFDYEKGGTNFSISQDPNAAKSFKSWYDTNFTSATSSTDGTTAAAGSTST